jgi:hypothetical protein
MMKVTSAHLELWRSKQSVPRWVTGLTSKREKKTAPLIDECINSQVEVRPSASELWIANMLKCLHPEVGRLNLIRSLYLFTLIQDDSRRRCAASARKWLSKMEASPYEIRQCRPPDKKTPLTWVE